MAYEIRWTPPFSDSFRSFPQPDPHAGALMMTLADLERDPFQRRLETHKVGKARNGKDIYSSDVSGRAVDRRLVWQLFNKTIVVLLYGTHAVQDRAKRMTIAFDERDQQVTVYEVVAEAEGPRDYADVRQEMGRAFMAWTDGELDAFGFRDAVVAMLRRVDSHDDLFDLSEFIPEHELERAVNLLAYGNPDGKAAADAEAEARPEAPAAEAPTPTDDDRELERQINDPNTGAWFRRLDPDELERVLAAPIEDWMLFLHPDQQSVVDRAYSGPARIRGSAGTGKTVVVLHRAATLANRYDPATSDEGGRILVTTFIKSLPAVLSHLYERLPNARPELVDFVHVDKLANRICREHNDTQTLDPRATEAARAAAWKQVLTPESPLRRLGITENYAGEEVTAVIKGRGINDLDSYLSTKRTGRKLQLAEGARRQIWDFYLAWEEGLRSRGVVDFADVIVRARDLARTRTEPTYRAALIDESQDLTLAGLQLIRSLVSGSKGTRPDALFLAGDGAQRIYPGGFTLRQAGIDVRGRTTVLRVNYRNTAEVLGIAMAATGDEAVEDLDEQFTRGGDAGDAHRHGPRPKLLVADTPAEQAAMVVAEVEALVADPMNGIDSGDIAVLCPTNNAAEAMGKALSAAHIINLDLKKYDGVPSASVKVGTHHRVKGLEFKAVILTDLSDGVFPRPQPARVTAEEWADQQATATAALFVAMTRARDQLVFTCVGHPSPVLEGALDRLDVVESVGGS